MNGGRNYNGPKVGIAALEKSDYMLGIPVHLTVLEAWRQATSENLISGDYQQERPKRRI